MASQLVTIKNRLKLMHDDIAGLTVFKDPPPMIAQGDYPVLYAVSEGYSGTDVSSDSIDRNYTFAIELLIIPADQIVDDGTGRTKAVVDAETLIDTIADYYDAHRYLSTDSLDGLSWVNVPGLVTSNDGFNSFFPLADPTTLHVGTVFTLTVNMAITF